MNNFYAVKKMLTGKIAMLIALFFLLCGIGNSYSANYYWVNGTGNWSDFLSHWATTSGGAVFHFSAPGQNDDHRLSR